MEMLRVHPRYMYTQGIVIKLLYEQVTCPVLLRDLELQGSLTLSGFMPYEAHCTNCGRFTLDNDTIGSNLSGHPFPLVFRSLPIKLCSSVIPVNKATRALGYHTFHLVVVFHENRNKFLTKYCLQIYQSLIALTTLVENKTLLHDTFIPKNKNKLNALVL